MYIPKSDEEIGRGDTKDAVIRRLLADAIKGSAKRRPQIAQEMSLRVGQRISKRMLDDWTAESKKPAKFPAAFVGAFCEVVHDDALQRHILGGRLRRLLELGERCAEYGWALEKVRADMGRVARSSGRRAKPRR
jgi:hypothetical protein